MDDGWGEFFGGLIIGLVIAVIGFMGATGDGKRDAVEHGCAYFHPETASFTWKEHDNGKH